MKEIKDFAEHFFVIEAQTGTRRRTPDLESYNSSVKELDSFLVDALKGAMGYMIMDELDDEEIYELYEGEPPSKTRHLFKISEYNHKKYSQVWLVYCSSSNPPRLKFLNRVFYIIKEQEQFKIAREYRYSDYKSNGIKYEWKGRSGYQDLTFESLDGPIAIERYQEPLKDFDGLKHYNNNI